MTCENKGSVVRKPVIGNPTLPSIQDLPAEYKDILREELKNRRRGLSSPDPEDYCGSHYYGA